ASLQQLQQQPMGNYKRKKLSEEEEEVTLEDMKTLYLILRVDLDKQKGKIHSLETEVCRLTQLVTDSSLPSASAPSTSTPPPPTVTMHDVTMPDQCAETAGSSKDGLTPPSPTPETPSDLERSVVIARLPTDPTLSPEEQVWRDYNQVVSLTSLAGIPALPVAVYRMPPGDVDSRRDRLTKVVLPTRQHAKLFVKNANRVSKDPFYRGVYIRPSYADRDDPRRKTPARSSGRNGPLPSSRPSTVPKNDVRANGIPSQARTRRDSVFSTHTNHAPSRPQNTRPSRPTLSRHQNPPPLFPSNGYGSPPLPIFNPQMTPHPFQYSFPNPFISHVSQYGAPPNFGTQGNWY
ncbi:hypothetical protein DXG03_002980, partial [Asterophora parasitica]